MKTTKNSSLLNNMAWKFAERISAQLVTLVVSIVLARLLDPKHYGLVALVTIFITFANAFVSEGFGSALIQKKDADAIDFSSVLWANLGISILFYILLFFLAPVAQTFFSLDYELFTPVMRVLGLRLVLSAINSVQQAYIAKHMQFRMFFLATLFGTIISAIVGLVMAYSGYGVWALVAQYLTNTTIDTIVLAITMKKIPLFAIDFKRLKELFKYGWKILGASLIINIFTEGRALIVGVKYSSADLSYYDKGKQYPSLVVINVNSTMSGVLFPKMANEQDDIEAVKKTTKQSLRFSSLIMFPIMIGLLVVARPFVSVLLTDKWLPCVPLLQMFCIIYLFQPIHVANLQAIKAMGRSDIYLKLEIVKKIVELVTLLIFMWVSVYAIVVSLAVITTMFTLLNAAPNRKLIGYGLKEQFMDMVWPLVFSTVMGMFVFLFGYIPMNAVLSLILQVFLGAIIYFAIIFISKNPEILYIKKLLKKRTNRRSVIKL